MAHWLSFLTIALASNGFIFVGTYFYTKFEPRARHWSAFWAAAILMVCALPVFAFIFGSLVPYMPVLRLESLPFHTPLSGVEQVAAELLSISESTGFDILRRIPEFLVLVYGLGLLGLSLRLFIGRAKAHHILMSATKKTYQGNRVYWSTEVLTSPFTFSPLGRPQQAKIVIPSHFIDTLSNAEIETIFLHEEAHIKRRDDEAGLVLRLILVVFWFNPACYLFFEKWKQSAEIQCDNVVTRQSTPEMRSVYAETLVKSLHIAADRVRQYPTASFSNPRLRNAKMRITYIMNGSTPTFKQVGHKLSLIVCMTVLTLAGAAALSSTAAADPKAKVNDIDFMLTGRMTSPYGQVRDPFREGQYRAHKGIDIAAPIGTQIHAPADGIILAATDLYNGKPAYGTVVVIQTKDETTTLFSHLDRYLVEAGQKVTKGQKIALVGNSGKSTAPHVHIETLQKGERVDPQSVWPLKSAMGIKVSETEKKP